MQNWLKTSINDLASIALKFAQKCDFRSRCSAILTLNFALITLKIKAPVEQGYLF